MTLLIYYIVQKYNQGGRGIKNEENVIAKASLFRKRGKPVLKILPVFFLFPHKKGQDLGNKEFIRVQVKDYFLWFKVRQHKKETLFVAMIQKG